MRYYVVDIDHILGPAALFRCPVNACIPPNGLDRVARHNPSARAESREGDGKGSPLFRLNMWYMRWGNTDQAMKMVRRFAEKSKGKVPHKKQIKLVIVCLNLTHKFAHIE